MNFAKILLIITTSILFVGCSTTPEDAVHNVYDAIKNGDMVKLINNSNYGTRGHFIKPALRECSVDKSKYKDDDIKLVEDCLREKYSDISVTIDTSVKISKTESDINITVKNNSLESTYQLKVMKVEGVWIVVAGK